MAVNVLVVVADEALRQVIEIALAMDGFAVRAAASDDDARAALAVESPGLLLLDGTMALSEDAVAWADYHAPAVPLILLVAAWGDAPDIARSEATVLTMPFGREELRRAINAVTRSPAGQ
jgi:DNA-binding response OmpR family regulator